MQGIQKFLNSRCKKHRTSLPKSLPTSSSSSLSLSLSSSSSSSSLKLSLKHKKTKRITRKEQRAKILLIITTLSLTYLIALIWPENFQLIKSVSAFNLDTQSATVHHGPDGSYFGYTVAQHKDRGVGWLLVGAPKARTDQPNTEEAGAVYRCSTSNLRACQQILFDPTGSSMIQLKNETKQTDDKSHQWFGASLQSATENGSIVACAHKYVYFSTSLKRRDPVGTCWVSRGSFGGFLEYSPCRLNDQWGHHHLGSCQAGFSSAISKDGSRLFMGAPGSHVWQGQVFTHNLRTEMRSSTSAVNPHSEDDSYLGYSLALGRFTGQPSNSPQSDVDVAIAIPRGAHLSGKVMIVDKEMRTIRNITGEQMGSYFGYSLATADVNGDGLDDLIIGAPLYYNQTISHKEPHFERGRIYVALQNNRHEFYISQRIDGLTNRARFGTSVANCGDLNRDGFQDIAVGAPFDGRDNHGAVYIFMGRKNGLADEPDQIIYAEDVRGEGQNLLSFGFSLSGGMDMDGNSYPDLLIGDYKADRVVMLRTRPVVNVTTSVTFQPEYFNLDDKTCLLMLPNGTSTSVSCITVQYCTKYSGLNVDNRLPFVHDIRLDTENKGAPRLFFLNNENHNEERNSSILSKDVNQCKSFKAYITKNIRDKLTPLKIDIDYNLGDLGGDSFDYQTNQPKLKPVLNKSGSLKLSKVATIQRNCGPDNVCIPDLKLTMSSNSQEYTIGSNEKLLLDVMVRNYGEDAFESMFYLSMPMTVNFITIANRTHGDIPICYGPKPDQTGVNVLACDLGNPQVKNDIVKFTVVMEPAKGMFSSPDFTFVANVNSSNPEQDDRHREDNTVAIGIPIKVEVNLVLSGNSNPASVVYNSSESLVGNGGSSKPLLTEADLGDEIYHNYHLQNKGPSTIHDIAVTILWPTKTKDGKYLLYLVDEPITKGKVRCKPAPDDAINPMGLKYLLGNSVNSLLTQSRSNVGLTTTTTTSQISTTNGQVLIRNKRQANSLLIGEEAIPTTTVDDSILKQLNLLACGPTQCTKFECNVFDLGNNETATIKIRSRLFKQTLSQFSLQEFDISSKLVAQIKTLPYNVSSHLHPPYVYKVETQVHTTGIGVQDLLPWWLIVLAILLGIGLFILLAWFLKYLGFFARKRPPKGAEREPLTPTMWNDYQYTPGDTAL